MKRLACVLALLAIACVCVMGCGKADTPDLMTVSFRARLVWVGFVDHLEDSAVLYFEENVPLAKAKDVKAGRWYAIEVANMTGWVGCYALTPFATYDFVFTLEGTDIMNDAVLVSATLVELDDVWNTDNVQIMWNNESSVVDITVIKVDGPIPHESVYQAWSWE